MTTAQIGSLATGAHNRGRAGRHAIEFYGDYTARSGYGLAKQALATAAAYCAVRRERLHRPRRYAGGAGTNLRVPDDISVVAFDDLLDVIGLEPFLTVIRQPAYEIGRRATALLLDRLSGAELGEPQEIILPTQLIIRQSSTPPAT